MNSTLRVGDVHTFTFRATVTCDRAEGRRLGWRVVARDELDVIGQKLDDKKRRLLALMQEKK